VVVDQGMPQSISAPSSAVMPSSAPSGGGASDGGGGAIKVRGKFDFKSVSSNYSYSVNV